MPKKVERALHTNPYAQRMKLFRLHLSNRMNVEVPMAELVELTKQEAHGPITPRAVKETLVDLRELLAGDYHLTIKEDKESKKITAMLIRTDCEMLTVRREKRPLTKAEIGAAVWKSLLNLDLPGRGLNTIQSITPELKERLAALRKKLNLNVVLDAGSTTSLAFEELMRVRAIPFSIQHGTASFLIRPTILTNSGSIFDAWRESKHRRALRLITLGGEHFPDRLSTCGPLADLCLDSWRHVRVDVCIIGTTACSLDSEGRRAFACDDLNEAKVKTCFFNMAWIKVLVIDSSKLHNAPASHIFAALHHSGIDLVVTDDGTTVARSGFRATNSASTESNNPSSDQAHDTMAPIVTAFQAECARAKISYAIVTALD